MSAYDLRRLPGGNVSPHRIGVLSAVGWCEGTINRDSTAYGARLFDRLRLTIAQGIYLRDATVDRFDFLTEMRIAAPYIEAVVDFGEPPVANRFLLQARSRLPIRAVTVSGARISGDLVVSASTRDLPVVMDDPNVDLRIVTDALIEIGGRRVVENATLLLDLRRVVFYGRPGDLPTWPEAKAASELDLELVTEIA